MQAWYSLDNTGVAHLPGGQRTIKCLNDGSLGLWDLEINT